MERISQCTKTKSILNVLGPIANQVLELRNRQGVVCDATTVLKLLKQCQDLETSCALLVSRLALYAKSCRDDVLLDEIKRIKIQLDKVTDSLTDATRDLHRGDVGVRDNEDVWAGIVEDTEQLLSTLTEALLAWDRAQLRKVTRALTHLQQCLHRLEQTSSIQHLPDKFQLVVSGSVDLLNLLEVRCGDLYRRAQRERVRLLALQLCHTLTLLASTSVATITQPLSKHIKASHELISNRLQVLLTDLQYHVGLGDADYDMEEAGSFTASVDKVLELLLESQDKSIRSTGKGTQPLSEHVKPLLEEVLRHGIAVAYCSSPDDNHIIMSMCENVLKQLKIVVSLERNGEPDAVDVQISCDILADSVELLEQKINTALIRLITKNFADPMTPIQSLMNMLSPEENTTDRSTLDSCIADFDLHVDSIFQIGGFATSCTSDITRVRLIRDSLFTLEWLESCFVPSVVSAYTDPHPNAYAQASMLAEHWVGCVAQLWDCLDNIMDPSAFSLVTKQEVHQIWAELKEQLYTQDITWIQKQVSRVVNLTSRILTLHEKNDFLTDLQAEDLQIAIREMKQSADAVIMSPTNLSYHRSLIKRVQLTLTLLSRLANSLNEDNIQPDEDFTDTEEHHKRVQSKPDIKLTKAEKEQLCTSNIKDIHMDVATPAPAISKSPSAELNTPLNQQQKLLRRSSRSISRLGEVRTKTGNSNMSGHHSRSLQALTSETLGCDTSIDITKFLSRSTNALSTSTRASRRNFTLRLKEINLDLNGALMIKSNPSTHPSVHSKTALINRHPKDITPEKEITGMNTSKKPLGTGGKIFANSTAGFSNSMGEDYHNISRLKEVSDMIAREETLRLPCQQSIGEGLSGILEDLTSITSNFTTLTTPSLGRKRKYQWENFEDNKEKSILHRITLKNASFNPKFPEIAVGEAAEIFHEHPSYIDQNYSEVENDSEDHLVWKDFTAILEKKTPVNSSKFDFSSNFSSWQHHQTPISFSAFRKKMAASDSTNCVHKLAKTVADLSDTPFLNPSVSIPTSSSRICNLSNSVGTSSSCSFSSSSASVSTPQRLEDLQIVHQRLTSLRRSLK
ncbi:hypothetical protein OTU49_006965 [Cherax quadricarinatus]|uniref:Serendipity locus protein alpha n=1 Tax=Cherax quadricarinatus TaxID=27406 RepID=A0AAW0WKY4_CHEQU